MSQSPDKGKRKSLTALFTELQIDPPSSSGEEPPSPIRRRKISERFQSTITSRSAPSERASMTIRMDDVYRTYEEGQNPAELFEKAQGWLTTYRQSCQTLVSDPEKKETLLESLHQVMIEAVFGSNAIERAGLGFDVTWDLCRKIFRGEDIGPGPIPDRDDEYLGELVAWIKQKEPGLTQVSAQHILRSRNEVVQHAKAMQHIIDVFVIQEQAMTEDLLKETHRILVTGVPLPTTPWENYAGQYRTCVVGAGRTNFTPPQFIAQQMVQLVHNLQVDMQQAEQDGSIDPVALATKYAMEFVQIHPFQDGNGRMCRLILNAILFRYTSTMVAIGEHGDKDRDEWIGIASRASNDCTGHGEFGTLVLKKWGPKIRRMKKKLAGKSKREV